MQSGSAFPWVGLEGQQSSQHVISLSKRCVLNRKRNTQFSFNTKKLRAEKNSRKKRMGNPKIKWTADEEEALRKGVDKHGAGRWKQIQKDPEFNDILYSRSNIDLKDKWRNWSLSATGQGKEAHYDKTTVSDVKNQFNNWILDAISGLKDPNGSDAGSIIRYIEEKHEVTGNFKRTLRTKLNKLVDQDKIEKGPNGYRMKNSVNVLPRPKLPISVPVVLKPGSVQTPIHDDTIEEAVNNAAYRIAEAENKSFVASEAVKEAEKVSKLAEDCEAVLFLAKEIFERCSRGEIVLMARDITKTNIAVNT